MSERTRRHNQHQARRQPQQLSQPGNFYSHHNNRSIYHGHPADNYSTSNYRHPSTTTTTTDPSSIATSQSDERCTSSICYSYLIAIFSSFLVVLGIYLSLTRFNVRYLYISLVGISVEAVGACIYCISNIRASKLARRKQRIDSDEFVLNSGVSLGNNNFDINHQRHQNQVTTVTHILSNQALTSGVVSNGVDPTLSESASSAINVNHVNQSTNQPASVSHQPIRVKSVDNNPQDPTSSERPESRQDDEDDKPTVALSSVDNQDTPVPSSSTHDPCPDELPKNTPGPQSPGATSDDCSSSTSLLEHRIRTANLEPSDQQNNFESRVGANSLGEPACPSNLVSQINSLISDIQNQSASTTTEQDLPMASSDLNDMGPPNSSNQQNTNAESITVVGGLPDLTLGLKSSGLVATSVGSENVEVQRRISNQQRSANLRRTLVMGLSGEEEMIEIDDRDLDNMSIPPPPYESIANDSRPTP